MKVLDCNLNSVLKQSKYVLLDWTASWCGPCKKLLPLLEEIEEEYDDVIFVKIDIDKYRELASVYNVSSIPTLTLFKNGKVINQLVGPNIEDILIMLSKR